MYFGIASNDDMRQPDAKDKLKEAFAAAKVPAEMPQRWSPGQPVRYGKHYAGHAWDGQLFQVSALRDRVLFFEARARFSRSTAGTRACAPSGAALRYWMGHEIDCPSSRAARSGQ